MSPIITAYGVIDFNLAFASGYGLVSPLPETATISIIAGSGGWAVTGTMSFTGPLSLPNGTAAAPALAFTNSSTTGLYRSAADVLAIAIAGVPGLAIGAPAPVLAAAAATAGQAMYIKTAAGGAGSSTTAGAAGAALTLAAGAGGAKSGTGAAAGGAGAVLTLLGGAGGDTASSGSDAGGAGGAVAITGGAGGAASAGTGNGGAGGSVAIAGGAGGTSAGGTAGARGTVTAQGLRTTSTTPTAITGTTSLVAADSGGIFTVAQSSAYQVTLPTPAGAGVRFLLQLVSAGAFNVTVVATGCSFEGTIVNDVTSVIPATGSTFTFASGTAALGDWIEFISTSTSKYFARAVTSAAGGITIA